MMRPIQAMIWSILLAGRVSFVILFPWCLSVASKVIILFL